MGGNFGKKVTEVQQASTKAMKKAEEVAAGKAMRAEARAAKAKIKEEKAKAEKERKDRFAAIFLANAIANGKAVDKARDDAEAKRQAKALEEEKAKEERAKAAEKRKASRREKKGNAQKRPRLQPMDTLSMALSVLTQFPCYRAKLDKSWTDEQKRAWGEGIGNVQILRSKIKTLKLGSGAMSDLTKEAPWSGLFQFVKDIVSDESQHAYEHQEAKSSKEKQLQLAITGQVIWSVEHVESLLEVLEFGPIKKKIHRRRVTLEAKLLEMHKVRHQFQCLGFWLRWQCHCVV